MERITGGMQAMLHDNVVIVNFLQSDAFQQCKQSWWVNRQKRGNNEEHGFPCSGSSPEE